jgi:hypothetical protein
MGYRRDAYTDLMDKLEGEKPLGKPRDRLDDSIKMAIKQVGWGVDWIDLVQDRDKWRPFVNMVMNSGLHKTRENFVTS